MKKDKTLEYLRDIIKDVYDDLPITAYALKVIIAKAIILKNNDIEPH